MENKEIKEIHEWMQEQKKKEVEKQEIKNLWNSFLMGMLMGIVLVGLIYVACI
jgi:uncharacterized protein (DUF2062 family)